MVKYENHRAGRSIARWNSWREWVRRLWIVAIVSGIRVHSVPIVVLMAGRCKHPQQAPCTAHDTHAFLKAWYLCADMVRRLCGIVFGGDETSSCKCTCKSVCEVSLK